MTGISSGKRASIPAQARTIAVDTGWQGPQAVRTLLYQIALRATHLRRCDWLVMAAQVSDLTHVYDVIIRHNVG